MPSPNEPSAVSLVTTNGSVAPLLGRRDGRWSLQRCQLISEDELAFDFCSPPDDLLFVHVLPVDVRGPVFRRLARCAVRYHGRIAALSPAKRAEVAAIVMETAGIIDAIAAGRPGASLAEALGRRRDVATVPFSPEGIGGLLGALRDGGFPGGHRICDVRVDPASGIDAEGFVRALIVEARRDGDERRLLFRVSLRGASSDGATVTPHLALAELTAEQHRSAESETVRALLGLVLQVVDHEQLLFERVPAAYRALTEGEPRARAAGWELHLVLNSDCGQRCEFCSLRDVVRVVDEGLASPGYAGDQLRAAAADGAHRLLLTGYDPLTHSRILDVLDEARRLGFREVGILSPSTRLADAAFAAEVVRRLPAARRLFVPLYGVDPAVHDRVVGRPGAHAEVLRALDVLRPLLAPDELTLTSVLTTTNLGQLTALAAFARARGHLFIASFPYPNHPLFSREFLACIPRQTEVIDAWFAARAPAEQLRIWGAAPCVAFRRAARERLALDAWLEVPDRPPTLPGYDESGTLFGQVEGTGPGDRASLASVPCPHADRCALRLACAGRIDACYAERHGLDELAPVALRELVEAARARRAESGSAA